MASLLVTERQVRFARQFLKSIKANQTNGYLLLAVIAWLKADKDVQKFFSWGNYKAGADALARVLLYNPQAKAKGYREVVAALRGTRDDARDENGKVIVGSGNALQARDFLTALAMSRFATSHYGAADGNELTNILIKKWITLTGGKAIPNAWFVDAAPTPPPPPPPPPRQPRSLLHVLPEPAYLKPYTSRKFYDERPHQGSFVLPQERW